MASPKKKTVLWLSILISVISGVVYTVPVPQSAERIVDIAPLVALTSLVFVWYCADADERGYRRTVLLNIFVAGLVAIALPYYFFRSRGLKDGLIALGKSLAFLALMWVTTACAGVVTAFALGA